MNVHEMDTDDKNRSIASFLDYSFQTSNDLDNARLKELLARKKEQQTRLDQELKATKDETQKTLSAILASASSQHSQLGELHSELAKTKEELQALHTQLVAGRGASNNEPRPSAVLLQQLASVEQKITRLNKAKGCVKTLIVATDLRNQAMRYVEQDSEKSITPYQQLVKFAQLFSSQSTSDNDIAQDLHKRATLLYQDLKDVLSKKFKACLDELGWPTPMRPPYGLDVRTKLDNFEKQFKNLALLKRPDADATDTPLPVAIMLDAISLRFRFHFESSKPTNRLDKPEWYFTHVKTTISAHIPFIVTTVQPLVQEVLGSEFTAKDLFIHELLKNVSRKLKHSMPKLRHRPRWLSHTIHEALDFDKTLQEDYAYSGDSMAALILDDSESYNAWFTAEKKFAQARYDEIAMDSNAYEPLEEDENGKGNNIGSKPTRIAVKLMNLLNSVTETYKSVPQLEQQLDFFLEIQVGLLNQFQCRLTSALDSFETLSLIRSVPVPGTLPDAVTGVMSSADYGGAIAALKRLCRWWASARTICNAIDECAVDDHFLDMQYRIRNNMGMLEALIASKKEKDPNLAFLRIPEPHDKTFLALAKDGFEQINQRAEEVMIRVVMKEWAADARSYAISWQLDKDDHEEEISPELYQPLQSLRLCCNYLFSNLPQADFVGIYRRLSGEVEEWHMRNVVAPNRLNGEELKRLERDLKCGLWKQGRLWVTKPENYMRKLKTATESETSDDLK
ncbi:TIP-1 family-domain-containing protein [Zychaea mexicana]|uniref:TIP-1 family-domain-containing protein n=1 Tax=Zychaea mexicana TaxID=64656 RepID=UPI0022FEBF75|nr:TIP-1 family-domain-containing protein [Zychaea mexicana]KAI9497486.1 TIP-1 family-domain-containing protein [Zychaea mexicana]